MKLNYHRCGDYLLPDLGLTDEEQRPLGKYGRMRLSPSRKNGHKNHRKSRMNQRRSGDQFRQRKRVALPQSSRERANPGRIAGGWCCKRPPDKHTV